MVEIYNFLHFYDWNKWEDIVLPLKLISKIIKNFPDTEFINSPEIKSEKFSCNMKVTAEQIADLRVISNYDYIQHMEANLMALIEDDIIKTLKEEKSKVITTDKFFVLPIDILNNVDGSVEIRLISNYKILTTKDLRKLKLLKIFENRKLKIFENLFENHSV